MHYVSVEGLSKSYGVKPLFNNITFHIEEGDKIALVARNGSGKSTLLRILAGRDTAENGTVWIHKDVTVALFEQEPIFIEDRSIGSWPGNTARSCGHIFPLNDFVSTVVRTTGTSNTFVAFPSATVLLIMDCRSKLLTPNSICG